MERPLISIIMPAYNAAPFVREAIASVLEQKYDNWELLAVDNGSTDRTKAEIQSFSDPRIRLLTESVKSVSSARNRGLQEAKGEFFCFLDADDLLSPRSLDSRLMLFEKDPQLSFVDGSVTFESAALTEVHKTYIPSYVGSEVRAELLHLTGTCFMGLSWMFRKERGRTYAFDTNTKYSEDMMFCLDVSATGAYAFVDEVVYRYRQHGASMMRNLNGLEGGYRKLSTWVGEHVSVQDGKHFSAKAKKVMLKSYLKRGWLFSAVRLIFSKFP